LQSQTVIISRTGETIAPAITTVVADTEKAGGGGHSCCLGPSRHGGDGGGDDDKMMVVPALQSILPWSPEHQSIRADFINSTT
jgi:hypothetical protein